MPIERQYYQDIHYKPYLFYVIFGVSADELQVSSQTHHVDALCENLQIQALYRKEHGEYMSSFFSGQLGAILKEENPALFEQCRQADQCLILRGDIEKDDTLDYMRNVIGILQALIEKGAIGILDLFTFSLYSPEAWTTRFFENDVNAQDHVMIFITEENDKYWLHTRGMIKFGRPDLSLFESDQEHLEIDKLILDQMIYYSGQGAFFDGEAIIHTDHSPYKVNCEFVPDWSNDDFNNAYTRIKTIEKVDLS